MTVKTKPAAKTDIFSLSGTKLAELVRKKKVSSLELVNAHIERVEKLNPRLNAMVVDRFDAARREAKKADKLVAEGAELPPFHGVPCSIKEAFAMKGMPHTGGLYSRKNNIASKDAVVVGHYRRAGLIPLGISNTPELNMWYETVNKIYGRTNNAYDQTRTAGGSSGGEGALVGSGCVPIGLGSDIAGSIRLPAGFNGIFGHKGSPGLFDHTGEWPQPAGKALDFISLGPMTRRAEDLYPLFQILQGKAGRLKKLPKNIDGATVHIMPGFKSMLMHSLSDEMQAAYQKAVAFVHTLDVTVSDTDPKIFGNPLFTWMNMFNEGNDASFKDMLFNGESKSAWPAMFKEVIRDTEYTTPALLLAAIESSMARFERPNPKRSAKLAAIRHRFHELLGPNGVMIFPSFPITAPKHKVPMRLPLADWVYTSIFNVMEVCVTHVPMGLAPNGLPTGVQVVAAPGNDHLTMKLATMLEQEFGGWVAPGYDIITNGVN